MERFRRCELISAKFKELNPIRNKIAHSRDLTQQELRRLRVQSRIYSSIERAEASVMNAKEPRPMDNFM